MSLLDVPGSLEFISSHGCLFDIPTCHALQHLPDNRSILFGCDLSLQVLIDQGGSSIIARGLSYACPAVHKGKVYLAYEKTNREGDDVFVRYVVVCNLVVWNGDLDAIFTFKANRQILPNLTVSDNYIALRFYDPQIKLYDRNTDILTTVSVPGFTKIKCLIFQSDNALLVLGHQEASTDAATKHVEEEDKHSKMCNDGKLMKFRIDDGPKLVELWSRRVVSSDCMTEGEGGLIYLGAYKEETPWFKFQAREHGTISVLSPSGM